MGEPCRAPTLTGAGVPGAPWKTSELLRSPKKEETQETKYRGICPP